MCCAVLCHAALQGGLIQMAELAWHQGVDLYSWNNSQLMTCMVGTEWGGSPLLSTAFVPPADRAC